MGNGYLSIDEANLVNNLMPGNQAVMVGTNLKLAMDMSIGGVGTVYYLDPTNGADSNDGLSKSSAFKTLTYAYSKLTDGKNDVLVYIAGTGSISLSAQLDWAKSYTHFIGLCAPTVVGQRARIFQTASATGVSSLIKVSGSSNTFKNLYVFQGVNDATSLVAVEVTGQRNYFENVHFAGIGNATQSATGSASLKINGGAENTFENCTMGVDTVARDADATEILFDTAATRNMFKNCRITSYISAAGFASVTVADGTAIDRWQIFDGCLFTTDSTNQAVSQTSVFSIPSGIVQGKIVLKNSYCLTDGTPDWDSNNRGIIWNNSVAAAASAAGGVCTKQ